MTSMYDISRYISIIDRYRAAQPHLIVAIDGRCASGKTTLARLLQAHYGCNVVPMDHFFLRPEQRTEERLSRAGENIDHERFLAEVLTPLSEGRGFSYRPFSCKTGLLGEPIEVPPRSVNIVEGSYSCNSALREHYHLRIFLTTDREEQMRRIISRDGAEKARIYKEKWIPLEERYFAECGVAAACDYRFST